MSTPIRFHLIILIYSILFTSCSNSDKHREEGKIFHAGPSANGIGSLYFALYDDDTYQICNSGGVGQDCYTGNFNLSKDTLTLFELNKEVPVKSNRLIIKRYFEQDSTFWKWKYAKSIGTSTWVDFKWRDSALGGTGNVYQLNDKSELMKDEAHFIIRLDSLKNYR